REILEHAGSIAHDDAAQKARLEYERWHKVELTAPTEAENHFVQAVQELKQIGKVIKPKVKK
ncbi:MAG: hydroxyacid dehydrogenase, partial [Candidatus Cloacimonetes bacterium]|nr:hydroxyacid dehydrogenase [Candidatus Cloacimonadota bacterium]